MKNAVVLLYLLVTAFSSNNLVAQSKFVMVINKKDLGGFLASEKDSSGINTLGKLTSICFCSAALSHYMQNSDEITNFATLIDVEQCILDLVPENIVLYMEGDDMIEKYNVVLSFHCLIKNVDDFGEVKINMGNIIGTVSPQNGLGFLEIKK